MAQLPSNSVYGYALDFAHIAADTQYTKAATDDVIVKTMMAKQKMQADQQYQERLNQYMSAQEQADAAQSAAGESPANEDVNTQPLENTPQGDPMARQMAVLQRQTKQAEVNQKLAQRYGMDDKPFREVVEKNNTEMGKLVLELQKENVRKQQQATQSLGAVDDSDGLKEAMSLVKDIDPRLGKQLEQKLPKDQDGNLVWNDQAKKIIAPVYSQFITGYQQGELKAKGIDQELRAQNIERESARDKETVRYHDQEIAVRRAGIAAANARQEKTLSAAGLRVDTKVLGDGAKQVETISKDYQYPQYQHSNDVATGIEAKLIDPKQGYEAVTTANARQLVEQFKLSSDNYRRQGGGKYTEQQINKMNSTLDKLEKYTTTIGEGDKLLAKDVMLSTSRAIKDLYNDQAVNVAKKELRAADILKRKGQDPTLIDYNAISDIPKLERAGVAKTVTVDGKKYVAFGKNKEDIFELPSAPERPKVVTVEGGSE